MPSRNAASRERIAAELMADPGRSDYLIAVVAQASQCLVRVVRRELEGPRGSPRHRPLCGPLLLRHPRDMSRARTPDSIQAATASPNPRSCSFSVSLSNTYTGQLAHSA